MTGLPLPMPVLRAVDANGAPLPGALMQFYVTGTTTPTPVYTDRTLSTPLPNPVAADAGGLFVPMYLDPSVTYRVQLLTAAMALIRDIDPVAAPFAIAANAITAAMLQAGVAVSNIGYTPLNKAGDTATNLLLSFTAWPSNGAGYLGAPVNEQDGAYTLSISDSGKMVRANIASATTYTAPPAVFPLGSTILIRNAASSTAVLTIARGAGISIFGAGGVTSKDWALAAGGLATLIGEATNTYVIGGQGLS